MIRRNDVLGHIKKRLESNPVVVILGSRQVGKTTMAKELMKQISDSQYLDLESFNTANAIKQDPESFLNQYLPYMVILDEVQEMPVLFSVLRSVVDEDRRNGRFLLLGSANPLLVSGVSESLAGRVSYVELSPLTLSEVGYEQQEKHWFRGGYPRAFLASTDQIFVQWIEDYIRAYAERDVNLIFNVRLSSTLIKRLWRMLAALNGSLLNSADLARSLGVSSKTVNNYIDLLEAGFLVYKLLPWYTNVGKRLVKSPKVYIADTGLLHGLNGIKSYDKLQLHPRLGASWESYVIHQIRFEIGERFDLYFYRTHNGSEVDLILVDGIKPIASIEIKTSNNPTISRGFYISIDDLKTKKNYVITKNQSYPDVRGIQIVSLSDFIREEIPGLLAFK